MDLSDLRAVAVTLAPELGDSLRLEQRRADWAVPTCAAFANRSTSTVVFVDEPTTGLLLHEVAHLVPAPPASAVTLAAAVLTPGRLTSVVAAESLDLDAEHNHHDAAFHRRAAHIAFRARRRGAAFDLAEMDCGSWWYDAPPFWQLVEALGDEPRRLEFATFGEIEATPAPAEFVGLFDGTREFYRSLRTGKSCLAKS